VSRRYLFLLLVLGAIWGSSYLFIKVGVRELSPAALIEIRLACAVPLLLAFAASRYGWRAIGQAWREGLVSRRPQRGGAVHADRLGREVRRLRCRGGGELLGTDLRRAARGLVPRPPSARPACASWGSLLGLAGVAILAGVHPAGGWKGAAGTGAVVVASVSYAAANLYAGKRMSVGGPVLAASSMAIAFVVLLPLALVSLPSHAPGWKSVGSGVILGLAGTALAQILSYRMIRIYGSSRSVLVAYTLPAFALFYGAVFLSEPLSLQKLAGLLLISGGVGLGSGVWRMARRTPVVQAP